MNINLSRQRNIMLISIIFISIFGVFMVKESSKIWAEYLYNDQYYFFKRQSIFYIVGLISLYIGMKINIQYLIKYIKLFLFISYILLILVLIPNVGLTKNGSTSWLGIGSFSFQPSEFFKISIILYNSLYLSNNYKKTSNFKNLLPFLLPSILGLILVMLQPDFGTSMVIVGAIFIQIIASKLDFKWFIAIIILGLVGIGILIFSKSYRMDRISAFIDPFNDPLGSGFQIIQSLYALGPGGLIGQGINGSIQIHYYLPEPQTDFIFAIIVEEFGLIGGLIVIGIYSLIIFTGFTLIKNERDLFKGYLALGLLSIFFIQVIINLGVVIGLFPVTGITLPLISYGGSSLVVIMFSLGLVINKGDKNENSNRMFI